MMYPDEKFKQIQSLISPTICSTHRIAMCSCTVHSVCLDIRTCIMLNPLNWNPTTMVS